jgi:O-antigen/teichoic acid export membrane protein
MFSQVQVFKDIASYSSSAVLAQGLGLISGFVVARWLGPTDYGILNVVSLVLIYGAYFDFGILPAMGRDLPLLRGQGDLDQAKAIESAAFGATVVSSVLVAVTVLALAFTPSYSPLMAFGLGGMAILLVLQRLYGYYITVLRGYNEFGRLSQLQALSALLATTLIVVGVLWLGFIGRIVAALLSQLLMLVYVVRIRKWEIAFSLELPVIWKLIKVGMPIIVSSVILGFLTTVDRVMIVTYLGETQLGYFGIAALIVSVVSLIPGMAVQALYPRMAHKYGESGHSIASLQDYVLVPSLMLGFLLPLLIGPVYLVLPFIVQTLLPAYTPGILAARIVLLGIFFFALLGLTDYFLVIIGKLKQYVFFACLALALNLILDLLFLNWGWGIVGIALGGTLITYFFYAIAIIGYGLSHYTRRASDWIIFATKLLAPYGYMLALLWGVEWLVNVPDPSEITSILLMMGGRLLLFGLGCLPLVYAAAREVKLEFSWIQLAKFRYLVR